MLIIIKKMQQVKHHKKDEFMYNIDETRRKK